jgi:sulfite reductase (NADPH) flavoprotein alpha-component
MSDTDYESEAELWFAEVVKAVGQTTTAVSAPPAVKKTTGKQTYRGKVITNINLNDTGSQKQTHHIELDAENVSYLPGDSLGIVPQNPGNTVDAILAVAGADGQKIFTFRNEEYHSITYLKRK